MLDQELAVLGLLDGLRHRNANSLLIFGRVPLFYFVIHLFVIHRFGGGAVVRPVWGGGSALHNLAGNAHVRDYVPQQGRLPSLLTAALGQISLDRRQQRTGDSAQFRAK